MPVHALIVADKLFAWQATKASACLCMPASSATSHPMTAIRELCCECPLFLSQTASGRRRISPGAPDSPCLIRIRKVSYEWYLVNLTSCHSVLEKLFVLLGFAWNLSNAKRKLPQTANFVFFHPLSPINIFFHAIQKKKP